MNRPYLLLMCCMCSFVVVMDFGNRSRLDWVERSHCSCDAGSCAFVADDGSWGTDNIGNTVAKMEERGSWRILLEEVREVKSPLGRSLPKAVGTVPVFFSFWHDFLKKFRQEWQNPENPLCSSVDPPAWKQQSTTCLTLQAMT